MDPQEGDIADLPDGRTATYQGGRWVVQGGAQAQSGPAGIPGFVPFQSPSDRRAEQRLDLTEQSSARQADAAERAVANDEVTQNRQGIQSETDLRKEFLSQPDAKDFPVIASSYQNVVATAQNDSAAGDLSLIFAFMKILDPNSVVREQEFANAQNAAGVPDQIRNAWNRALSGERLAPAQRMDFVKQAQSVYGNRVERYNTLAERYRGLAGAYGFVPDQVALVEAAPETVGVVQETGESPNALSAQGYKYNGESDRWVRDAAANETIAARREAGPLTRRVDAVGRGIADTVTFGFADEITAGANTLLPLDAGTRGGWQDGFSDAYRRNLDLMRGIDQEDAKDIPLTRGIGQVAGGLLAPGSMAGGRLIAAAPTALGAAGRGMMVGGAAGAAYGAGSAQGPIEQRIAGAQDGAVTGAMAGGALGGGGRVVGNAVGNAASRMMTSPRAQQVQTLRNHGVSLTPGQQMGGMAKNAEDLAMRAPILGTAIRGARERGRDSLNRAVGNRALDHIGEGVPANVDVGGDMVAHVQGRLGAEFDRAYSMVPEFNVNDEVLTAGMARVGQAKADLPPDLQTQFDTIIGQRLARLEGATTGQNVGSVRSELNTLASRYLKMDDVAHQDLGAMLAEVGDELDGAISRASPEAGEILGRARAGYSDYIRLEKASTNAGGAPFAPGQLASAVKSTDGTVRHGGIGRGEARMQDLSGAARAIMPDQFGNPGTADSGALLGLGVLAGSNPVAGAGAAAGLGAAATPYLMMGRKVVERLPPNATREQLQAAAGELDQLAAQDSNVIVLRDEIARRIAQAVPAGAQQTVGERRLMTGPR